MIDATEMLATIQAAADKRDDEKMKAYQELEDNVVRREQEVESIIKDELPDILRIGQALVDKRFIPEQGYYSTERLLPDGNDHTVGFCGDKIHSIYRTDAKQYVRGLAWIGGGYDGEYNIKVMKDGFFYTAYDDREERVLTGMSAPTLQEKEFVLRNFLHKYAKFKGELKEFVKGLPK